MLKTLIHVKIVRLFVHVLKSMKFMNLELFFVKSSNWGYLKNIKSKNCFVIREFCSNPIYI